MNNIIFDYIIISPGIDINNCSIKNFLNQNKNKLITELDIFYVAYTNNKKKDLPLNELLLTTQAGKTPNKRAKKDVKKIK